LIQSATVNTARFDHDPVTLACRGLLIEESRTNLLLRSEGLDASPWIQINTTTITSNNTTAPDGATTAERFTVGATTQAYGFFNSTTSWTSGVTYTSSFFLKADQVTRVRISAGSQATHPISAIFDLTGNGSIVGTPTGTAYIERYANGWYRCSVTATSTATGLTSLRVTAVTGTNDNYPGNSVDSFWAWGAQNEVGSFATSYIPTVASSVVRSADVCSITGSAFTGFFGSSPSEFTYNTSLTHLPTSALIPNVRVLSDSTSGPNRRWLYGDAQANNLFQGKYFEVTNNINLGAAASYPYKVAISYTPTTNYWSVNGRVAASGVTSGALLNSVVGLQVGQTGSYHFQYLKGYKKRLSNDKLQALTV